MIIVGSSRAPAAESGRAPTGGGNGTLLSTQRTRVLMIGGQAGRSVGFDAPIRRGRIAGREPL